MLSSLPSGWSPMRFGILPPNLRARDESSSPARQLFQDTQDENFSCEIGLDTDVSIQTVHITWPIRHEFLTHNPCSAFWTRRTVEEKPTRVFKLAGLYVLGILGYAFEVPLRIALFVKELFSVFIFVFHEPANLQNQLIILGGATGRLTSSIIGVVIPPLAYEIDEKLSENELINESLGRFGRRSASIEEAMAYLLD